MSRSSYTASRGNKYHAVKTTVDNLTFDSAKEARRYAELKLLYVTRRIEALELQPAFEMAVTNPAGKRIIVGLFHADFRYREHGADVIEDVKSPATRANEAYRLRKRIVEAQYGVTIVEV